MKLQYQFVEEINTWESYSEFFDIHVGHYLTAKSESHMSLQITRYQIYF